MITVLVLVALAALVKLRGVLVSGIRRTAHPGRKAALVLVTGIVAFQALLGSPAMAQDANDCVPNPERPGAGMVGALDPPQGNGEAGSPYITYAYAGMVWHVYDESCGGLVPAGVSDPGATIDTWVGNELFNVAKNIVGATNSLHYTLLTGGVLGGLNEQIGKAADAVFDNIYTQLFSIFMLVLAILMFRQIWKGDLATVSKRALFALAGMWLAASSAVLVSNYDRVDDLIVRTTTGIQAGFVDPQEDRVVRHVLPTELHNKVVYENWARGEFGAPDSPQAEKYGPRLLAAQAWTRDDVVTGKDADNAAEQAKKADYKQIATELGPATGYFKGTDGSRTGAGILALFQSIVYSLFQLFAKLAVLLAQLLLRILALTAPIIGLVALIHHDILRKVGRAVGAVVLNVLVLAMLAGVHFKFLELIFSPGAKLSLLTQMLLAAAVTLVFFLVGRPMRRMWQMLELSVGAAGASMPAAGSGIFSRFRRGKHDGPTPQDEFWETVRDGEAAERDALVPAGGGRRPRPEASNPVTATAQRMDTRARQAAIGGSQPLLGPAGAESGDLVVSPGRGTPGTRVVLGGGGSRTVDTVPVADRGWDRGEDSVVVPSMVTAGNDFGPVEPAPALTPAPKAAEVEMVQGRPVHVVYRPSRGLEVAPDGPPRRLPLNDGPLGTDTVVR
ncbi:magnesium transporter [Actinokineospora sp. PR83]|uniref:magnesium transporter n=1 Tax=Actinokineospora sp. PR83 TaxID=2884908 RepID=UPI001F28201E|nr:magnesium transporter [Actinokineospora sp. PR83]MCG8920613.1 magnesium transporter [Actinokineospora sp. PR83]